MAPPPDTHELEALVNDACEGVLPEAEAESLFNAAKGDAQVGAALAQQLVMDRILRVALASHSEASGGARVSQLRDAPWLKKAPGPQRGGQAAGRRWRLPALTGATMAIAAALVLWGRAEDARDARQATPQTDPKTSLTASTELHPEGPLADQPPTSPEPIIDDNAVNDIAGLVVRRVVLTGNPENLDPRRGGWEVGKAVGCPPGANTKLCMQGVQMGEGKYRDQLGVTLGNWRRALFAQDDSLYVVFDYWVGDTTATHPRITLAVHGEEGRTYRLDFPTQGKAAWAHVVTPLRRARYWHDATRTLAPGEGVSALHITIDVSHDDVFFIANLKVVEYDAP